MKSEMKKVQKRLQFGRNTIIILALIVLLLCAIISCASADGDYVWPVPSVSQSSLSRGYGWSDWDNSFHEGIDIVAGLGTRIVASRSGIIVRVLHEGHDVPNEYYGAGNAVVIRHDDWMYTHYLHMNELALSDSDVGRYINAGETIGYMGKTGNASGVHLHFAIADNDYGGGGRIDNNPGVINYVSSAHISLGSFDGFLIAQEPWKHIVVNNNNSMNVELEPSSEARGTAQGCWHFEEQSDGSYVITSLYNGMALDVENVDSLGAGTNVRLYNRNVNATAQHWYLMSDTSIAPQLNESIRLDVVGGVFDNGKSIQVFTSNGTAAQNIWPYKLSYDTTNVFPTNLTIDSTLSVPKGEKATIGYRFTPQNSHVPYLGITWSTSNSSIATVSSTGEVTGISPGTATITAVSKFNDRWVRTCTVTVESILEVPVINNISVNGCSVNLSWTASPLVDDNDVRIYEVKVWDSTGSNMVTYSDITDTNYEFSVAFHGNYSLQVTAINNTDGTRSKANTRSFIALDEEWMDFYWLPYDLPEDCEVQYVNHYNNKEQTDSPGEGWIRGESHAGYVDGEIEDVFDEPEPKESDTRVLIGSFYYHYCDGNDTVERFQTDRFRFYHIMYDTDNLNEEFYEMDGDFPVYKVTYKHNGTWATCDDGEYKWPLALHYKGFRYQHRKPITTYTWSKEDTTSSERDPNADSVTYRVREVVIYDNRLVIPTSTTRIEDEAFMNNTMIQEVVVPSECEYIGSKAFSSCTGLRRVYVPVGTQIESDAFEGCNAEIIRTGE